MLIGSPFEVFHIVCYIMMLQRYWFLADSARRLVFLWRFVWCFCGNSFGVFAQFAIPCEPLRQRKFKLKLSSQVQAHAFSKTSK